MRTSVGDTGLELQTSRQGPTQACYSRACASPWTGVNVFFAVGEGPDDKCSEQTLLQLHQGGLGLPDRDYYFDEDKKAKRDLYTAHVATVLGLLGDDAEAARRGAEAVLRLETALAAAHLTRTEARDPETTYNKMSPAKLAAQCKGGAAGGIDWPRYLELIVEPSPKPACYLVITPSQGTSSSSASRAPSLHVT